MFDDGDLMTSHPSIASARRSLALACAALFAMSACGPAATTALPTAAPSPAVPSASAATVPSADAAASPSASVTPLGTVRLALDWTPNTNHTGIYVASSKGWYDAAGVDLEILPYGTTTPEALMAAGQAECGISFQDALTFAAAAGAPIVSVMAILQHTAQEIAVLASSDITRPRQLDGKTYAGFGYPNEEPTLKSVIKADGGKGTFTTVTLDTAAYDALYAKRADFVITFAAWEGIEAKERGIDLRTFRFGDYGFPDFYQVVLACDSRWLAAHPDLARAFVGATARGFDLAASDPDEGARLLVSARTRVSSTDRPTCPSPASASSRRGGYLRDASGAVGRQTLAEWQGYSGFLFDQGLLAGPDGKPLDDRAGLRRAVHERLPAVRSSRTGVARWGPPLVLVGLVRPCLGGLCADRGSRPDHAAAAVPRRRCPVGLPRGRGRPSRPDARRGDHRLRRLGGPRRRARPSHSIAGSRSGARSSRFS